MSTTTQSLTPEIIELAGLTYNKDLQAWTRDGIIVLNGTYNDWYHVEINGRIVPVNDIETLFLVMQLLW